MQGASRPRGLFAKHQSRHAPWKRSAGWPTSPGRGPVARSPSSTILPLHRSFSWRRSATPSWAWRSNALEIRLPGHPAVHKSIVQALPVAIGLCRVVEVEGPGSGDEYRRGAGNHRNDGDEGDGTLYDRPSHEGVHPAKGLAGVRVRDFEVHQPLAYRPS